MLQMAWYEKLAKYMKDLLYIKEDIPGAYQVYTTYIQ